MTRAKKTEKRPTAARPEALPPTKKASNPNRTRKRFTPDERAKVLAEAQAQKLTGKQVAKKYGISMVTYYLWRKKTGQVGKRGRRIAQRVDGTAVTAQESAEVRAKVRELLPAIVREEVAHFLKAAFK